VAAPVALQTLGLALGEALTGNARAGNRGDVAAILGGNEFFTPEQMAAAELEDKWLNLSRLELQVHIDNGPAIRLYEEFGFAIEGTVLQFAFRDGQLVNAYTMARVRES